MGDACMDPAVAVERVISYQYGPAVADYYIKCPIDGAVKESGPLNTLVRQARLKIDKTEKSVAEFVAITELNYSPKDVTTFTDKFVVCTRASLETFRCSPLSTSWCAL